MRIISFAHTTPALLAGAKTVTRRQWQPRHAAGFRAGELVAAYDRSPRFGGHKVAIIRLTHDPRHTADLPPEDYEHEGLGWLQERGLSVFGMRPDMLWRRWQSGEGMPCWVVRFEVLQLTP